MKFQPDHLPGTNVVTRIGESEVWVGNTAFRNSVLVPWNGPVQPWRPAALDELDASDFAAVLALQPEVVIFGSGARLKSCRRR